MCITISILVALAWLFLGSYLLFLSWNKVVCSIAKLNQVNFWQVLLVVATVAILCLPKYAYRSHMSKAGMYGYHSGMSCPFMKGKKDCPWAQKGGKMMEGKMMDMDMHSDDK